MPQRTKIDSHEWVVQKEGTITTLSSAVALSDQFSSSAEPPVFAILQAFTQNVRYTLDGSTTPTASVGFQLAAASMSPSEFHEPAAIAAMKLIEETASASVHYVFYTPRR